MGHACVSLAHPCYGSLFPGHALGQVRKKDMAWKKLKYVMLWSRDDLLTEILDDLTRSLCLSTSLPRVPVVAMS